MAHPGNTASDAEIKRRYLLAAKLKREQADGLMIDARSLLAEAADLEVAAEGVQDRMKASEYDILEMTPP